MGLLVRYQTALKEKQLKPDVGQMQAVRYLNNLQKALNNKCGQRLKSVYIYGDVGRGKSMIMNLFCADLRVMYRRVHFHAFMEELHARLHAYKGDGDAMAALAQQIGGEARVLCFDEFYITNIADAMLLGRLFEQLFAANVLVVATSNWAVDDLFQGGVNRVQFQPFIKLMQQHMDVIELVAGVDYRTLGIKKTGRQADKFPYYFFVDRYQTAEQQLAHLFTQFTHKSGKPPTLPDVLTPKRLAAGVAWYSFGYLCDQSLGREEYLALAQAVDTVIVENIPLFSSAEVDAALRFVTLVDILYEHKVRLICSAAQMPQALCLAGDAAPAFKRTASRMMEMQGW